MYKTELQDMKSVCLKMSVFTEDTGFLWVIWWKWSAETDKPTSG